MYFKDEDTIRADHYYVRELTLHATPTKYAIGYYSSTSRSWTSIAFANCLELAHLVYLALNQTTTVQDAEFFPQNLYAQDITIIPPHFNKNNVTY